MEIENAVRCMRHCSSDWNIFYVNFPASCPICGSKLKGSFLAVPPFCVPHPFVSSSAVPFSVVVKPTDGCFLDTYQNGHDLHIGITTSSGLVYNYNELGVHIDQNTPWSLCASLNLSNIVDSRNYGSWKLIVQNWDDKLKIHSQKPDWSHKRYDAFSHNCYNFVLSFLRILLPERLNFQDKETFCKDYIVPLTTRVAQYIDLRRKVLSEGAIVTKATPT